MLGWALGLVFALIFAVLAYLYYWIAVVLLMGAAGFAIGSGIIVAFGISWNWLAVLVGLALGVVLGLVSAFTNVPMMVLILVGSIAGAVGVTGGLMLVVGSLNTDDFNAGDFTDSVSNNFAWSLLLLALAVAGIVIQARQRAVMRQTIRETWYVEGLDVAPAATSQLRPIPP